MYGGSDWPLGVTSGLASNPTFFNFRKGKQCWNPYQRFRPFSAKVLSAMMRMKVEEKRYLLHQDIHVPYYQPLPKN